MSILALHVDDAICGSTTFINDVVHKVSSKLNRGAHLSTETSLDSFQYKGMRIKIVRHEHGWLAGNFEISLDANEYLDAVLTMKAPRSDNNVLLNGVDTNNSAARWGLWV